MSDYLCLDDDVTESPAVLPLNRSTLTEVHRRGIPVPAYDRDTLDPRIVHIGVGGFHRSHMALYTDELARSGGDWRIAGLGVLPGDQRIAEALAAQDHLYTLIERQSDRTDVSVIGSITECCWFAFDSAAAADRIARPEVAIVSLTITESGYVTEPGVSTPALDAIVAGLALRRAADTGPLTVLSCDNLPGNGDVAHRAVLAAAARRDDDLAAWIDAECTFPNCMVDRITPVTTDGDRAWLRESHGIDDRWPVVGEAFRQWVIQDRFVRGRPAWEEVGVLFTDDVHAWELYKLRMLNAAHSTMAYLCALAGIEHVDEGVTDPAVRHFLDRFLEDEAIPTLHEIAGHPREGYAATVLARFANTGVRDQISRLCIDGTAKFPIFLIPTIEAQLAAGGPIERSALALAGWARYLATTPREQQSFDASADRCNEAAARALTDPLAFLDLDAVFPPALRDHARFRAAFATAWEALATEGPHAVMMS